MAPPIIILDGGLGTSLESKHSVTFSRSTPLWSSDLLVTNLPTLLECQKAFGDVPVDILLTATYQVSTHAFKGTKTSEFPEGIDAAEIPTFLDHAVTTAEKAKQSDARVALSVGPYGATMIPGQEYSGKYDERCNSQEGLEKWHAERMHLFASIPNGVSRLSHIALETIPRLDEIIAMRKSLDVAPTFKDVLYWTAILSPSEDLALPDGSSIASAVEAMLDPTLSSRTPWGIGINCTKVWKLDALLRIFEDTVSELIKDGKAAKWPALVLYPDGTNGEVYNTTTQKWEMPDGLETQNRVPWEAQLAEVVKDTQKRGKWEQILVGGCCKASSEDIAKLRKILIN